MKKHFLTIVSLISLGAIGRAWAQDRVWTLDECMKYAVENSPAAVRQQLANANLRTDYNQAIMTHLPSLGASTSASASYGRNINPADNTYTNVSTFSNSYSVNASIPIFNGLSILNNTRAAKVAKLRGYQEQQQVEDQIAMKTMQAYYDLNYAMGTAKLAQEEVRNSNENLRQSRRMLELGIKSAADVAQMEADLAAEEYNLIKAENNLRTRELKLKEGMNFPSNDALAIDTVSKYALPAMDDSDVNEMVEFATLNLPSAQMAKMDVRTTQLKLSTSKAKLAPSLSAWGSIGTNYYTKLSGGAGGNAFNKQFKDNLSKSFGGTLSIPIFSAWSRSSDLIRAKNNLRQQEQHYIESVRTLAVEVEQAVLDLNGAYSEMNQAQKQVKARELAHRAAVQKYNEGLMSALDLHTVSNQLLLAKANLLNAELTWQAKRRIVDYYQGTPLLSTY